VENKTAIKINNLIVAHWLIMMNILCKRGGVKWRNCYQRATLTSRGCLPALSHTGVYQPGKLASKIPQSSWLFSVRCFATEVVSLDVLRR